MSNLGKAIFKCDGSSSSEPIGAYIIGTIINKTASKIKIAWDLSTESIIEYKISNGKIITSYSSIAEIL